jgi:hypothetical protein
VSESSVWGQGVSDSLAWEHCEMLWSVLREVELWVKDEDKAPF